MRFSEEGGAGSVLALGIIAALLVVLSFGSAVGSLTLGRNQLQSSVDLAALAADQNLRGLSTGIPCDRARQVLTLNMSKLVSCLIVGEVTTVAGTATVMGIVLNATATAEPR